MPPADERGAFTKSLAHVSVLLKKALTEAAKPSGRAADTSVSATQHVRVSYRRVELIAITQHPSSTDTCARN